MQKRILALVLTLVMALGMFAPVASAAGGNMTYAAFLADLKVLEGYAEEYADASHDANELVINFIRTGVDKYTTDTWSTMAGAEITGFTQFVAQKDADNGTTASALRDLNEFVTPNGQMVEFEHMFGAMNIAYINSRSADLGSWAGDLCDLVSYTKGNVSGSVEAMIEQIRDGYFGNDADGVSGFGMLDVYGDLDAYYFTNRIKAGARLSSAMEQYYTASLNDSDRAAYFLNNRFSGLKTKEDVRDIIFKTYSGDVAIRVLEADYGITSADADLRMACCYCFADYLFELAGDRLEGGGNEEEETDKFYTVFSSKDSTLAPGVEQNVSYALTKDDKQLVYYSMTIDVSRDDVQIHANYKAHDPSKGWGMARVTDQIVSAMAVHSNPNSDKYIENFNVIGGVNGDFYNMSTGKPSGSLVMDGVVYNPNNNRCFFAILNDGSAAIGNGSEWSKYAANVKEAVGGSAVILRDGKISTSAGGDRAPRTVAGIKADGKVVLMVLDGRQNPFSVGTTLYETAQIMLDAGCVIAVNLDGGGSSTFATKAEGSDSVKVISSPSDGYVRSVSSSLLVASTAYVSTEFDHAIITSDYDYLTINTQLPMTAIGVSDTGNAAELPENATWQVSDETIGMIEDGIFTALDNGETEIQLVVDGEVVGSKTVYVVVPDLYEFEKDPINVICGIPTRMPLKMSYNGNTVAFNDGDYFILIDEDYDYAGSFEGLYFTANEGSGVRSVICAAISLVDEDVGVVGVINIYESDEAYFDFENATAGNHTLAWKRLISNSRTDDDFIYEIVDVNENMEIKYTFAMDMQSFEIPEKLSELTYMIPGSDVEGVNAWMLMLQLAERVSPTSEVVVTARFDSDVELDISEMTISNEYFALKEATVDNENNVITIKVNWIKQTQPIDPISANPLCILSGVKATPKEGASWDSSNRLLIANSGEVTYTIGLRASALYSFVQDPENQKEFSLYPYENPDDPKDKGGCFTSTYANFEDSFILSKPVRDGWTEIDGKLYYYVNSEALTGNHRLPSQNDPSQEYLYSFDENGVCSGLATGLIEIDDNLYYAILGEIKTGWREIDGNYYYFDPTTGAAVDGEQVVTGYRYTFTNYILTKGQITKVGDYYRYYWAGGYIIGKWVEVDGLSYYATYPKGYFATGVVYARNPEETATCRYIFDDKGVFQNQINGLYDYDGKTYYVVNGQIIDEPGLVYVDGYYYYFCSTGAAIKSRTYWITKTNGLLPAGPYYFDAEGKMANPPEADPDEPSKPDDNGPEEVREEIVDVGGTLYYYKNGSLKYGAGLILLDGYYYYVRSNAQLAIGKYWVTVHNDLVPEGMYNFANDGKMIDPPAQEEKPTEPEVPTDPVDPNPPAQPTVKEGIYEEGGVLYFYEKGTRAYGLGLIFHEGYYYYVRSNAQLAIGKYWTTVHNGLLPEGTYTFGEDGKMLNPPVNQPTEPSEPTEPEEPAEPSEPIEPEVKNGIYRENGALYYYENGSRAYCKGLILLDGDYYYVRSNAQLAIGKYWITVHNDLLPEGTYTFGEDGKMIR